jgi:hypothetical protein
MKNAASKETKKAYNLFTSNCTHNVEKALNAGGLVDGDNKKIGEVEVPLTNYSLEVFERNYSPSDKYDAIKSNNKGKSIDQNLKPQDKSKEKSKKEKK